VTMPRWRSLPPSHGPYRPGAFLPDLAASLNNQSGRLAELGRGEEALAAVEEAVTAYRQLADARPLVYSAGQTCSPPRIWTAPRASTTRTSGSSASSRPGRQPTARTPG
jgi:hypothetical protein